MNDSIWLKRICYCGCKFFKVLLTLTQVPLAEEEEARSAVVEASSSDSLMKASLHGDETADGDGLTIASAE